MQWLQKFMMGRYGADQLNLALIVLALVLSIVFSIVPLGLVGTLIAMIPLVLAVVPSREAGDYLLAGANVLLGVYNLLHLPALDGGRILYLLISWALDPMLADRVCRWVGLACGGVLTALALALVVIHRTGLFLLFGALGALLPQLPLAKRRQSG